MKVSSATVMRNKKSATMVDIGVSGGCRKQEQSIQTSSKNPEHAEHDQI